MKTSFLVQCFPTWETELLEEIEAHGQLKSFTANDYIVKQGQYIRTLPLVISGYVKMFSTEAEVQFLLYYITAGTSCIYSFAHLFNEKPADFSAQAEEDSELLLLPIEKVKQWLIKYPAFSSLVLTDYQKHYEDLLQTTKQVICYNLDERLIDYLRAKARVAASDLLSISHQQIADDLGTSREVISRVLKKLSLKHQVEQQGRKIKVL